MCLGSFLGEFGGLPPGSLQTVSDFSPSLFFPIVFPWLRQENLAPLTSVLATPHPRHASDGGNQSCTERQVLRKAVCLGVDGGLRKYQSRHWKQVRVHFRGIINLFNGIFKKN